MTIRDILRQILIDEFGELYGIPCTVKSVDLIENTCVCSPVNGDADFLDVRLKAGEGTGVLMIPKLNSVVILQPITPHTGYISLFSEIESIKLLDGSFQGLVKVADLVTDLNGIKSSVNDLRSAINGWTPVANDGGAALKTALASWLGSTLSNSTIAALQNDKITHGTV